MPTVPERLALAGRCCRAGDYPRAEQLYREILQSDPDHAQAAYLLGVACQAQDRLDDAIAGYRQAVRARPDHFAALNNLGVALAARGELDAAIASYRRASRCSRSRWTR